MIFDQIIINNILSYFTCPQAYIKQTDRETGLVNYIAGGFFVNPAHIKFRSVCTLFNETWKKFSVSAPFITNNYTEEHIKRFPSVFRMYEISCIQRLIYKRVDTYSSDINLTIAHILATNYSFETLSLLNGCLRVFLERPTEKSLFVQMVNNVFKHEHAGSHCRTLVEFYSNVFLNTNINNEYMLKIFDHDAMISEYILTFTIHRLVNIIYHSNNVGGTSRLILPKLETIADVFGLHLADGLYELCETAISALNLFIGILLDYGHINVLVKLPIIPELLTEYIIKRCRRHKKIMQICDTQSPTWNSFAKLYRQLDLIITTPGVVLKEVGINADDFNDVLKIVETDGQHSRYICWKILNNIGGDIKNIDYTIEAIKFLKGVCNEFDSDYTNVDTDHYYYFTCAVNKSLSPEVFKRLFDLGLIENRYFMEDAYTEAIMYGPYSTHQLLEKRFNNSGSLPGRRKKIIIDY